MAYERKTIDTWEIQGFYCGCWEYLTTEYTREDAKKQLKCYNENERGVPHRIKYKRERKNGND